MFAASVALAVASTLLPLSVATASLTAALADASVETGAVLWSFLISFGCGTSGFDTWLGSDTVILDVQYDEFKQRDFREEF